MISVIDSDGRFVRLSEKSTRRLDSREYHVRFALPHPPLLSPMMNHLVLHLAATNPSHVAAASVPLGERTNDTRKCRLPWQGRPTSAWNPSRGYNVDDGSENIELLEDWIVLAQLVQKIENTKRKKGEEGTPHVDHKEDKTEPSNSPSFVDINIWRNKSGGNHSQSEGPKDFGRPIDAIVNWDLGKSAAYPIRWILEWRRLHQLVFHQTQRIREAWRIHTSLSTSCDRSTYIVANISNTGSKITEAEAEVVY